MKRIIGAILLLVVFTSMFTACGLTVPRPEIKKGEFNFSITYELNGEVKTFSAVYVCEFDGISWSLDGGYGRDWKAWTEGDYKGDTYSAIIGTTDDGGDIVLFFGICPEYFMNDPAEDGAAPVPSIYVSYPENADGESTLVNIPEEVEELCGAKIISYEYGAPIENTFGLFY